MSSLLHYRAWQGDFRSPWWSVWPIARVALGVVLRRKLFWTLYGFAMLLFLMFFFGTFLLAWAQYAVASFGESFGRAGNPERIIEGIRRAFGILNGSQETFSYFLAFQGSIVIVTLSLVGSIMVGNDFIHKSLVFYLAKPINRWHYLLGKSLAVFVVVHLMTTLPALLLFGQHTLDDWDYALDVNYFLKQDGKGPGGIVLLAGVIGYGTLQATFLAILLVATASWVRRTMPLIMVWMSLFFFLRMLSSLLVDGMRMDARFRLIDLWSNVTIVGNGMLGFHADPNNAHMYPEYWQAALVLIGVCVVCLIYLNLRTRGVEVVS